MTKFAPDRFYPARFVMRGEAGGVQTPAAPVSVLAPAISPAGSAPAGTLLTCSPGAWTGYPSPAFSYAWKRDGTPIGGATGATYTPVEGDVGGDLSCTVTATNSEGSAEATSAAVTVSAAPSGAFSTAFSSAFDRAA